MTLSKRTRSTYQTSISDLTMKIATITLNPAIDRNILYEESLLTGGLNRVSPAVVNAGGKGINVSRMLKRLGIEPYTYGFIGGYTGNMLVDMLKNEGIETQFTKTFAETRMNIKITDKTGSQTEINEHGGPVNEDELKALIEQLKKSDADVFIIGGSTPKGLGSDTVCKITGTVKLRGKQVICDVSGEPLKKVVEIRPYLIKPNKEEFCELLGFTPSGDKYYDQAVKFYMNTGVEILLTLGKDGAVYSGRGGNYVIKNPEVKAKGFSGAGDTFLASFVYAITGENPIKDALRFASAASLSKVTLEGTNLPDLQLIRSNLESVSVKEI